MIYTSPAQVGPSWFSDLFFFILSVFVRAAELFYTAVDAVAFTIGVAPEDKR